MNVWVAGLGHHDSGMRSFKLHLLNSLEFFNWERIRKISDKRSVSFVFFNTSAVYGIGVWNLQRRWVRQAAGQGDATKCSLLSRHLDLSRFIQKILENLEKSGFETIYLVFKAKFSSLQSLETIASRGWRPQNSMEISAARCARTDFLTWLHLQTSVFWWLVRGLYYPSYIGDLLIIQ